MADWTMARRERVEKAKELLDQASRLLFQAQLELRGSGAESALSAACETADQEVRKAKDIASVMPI